MLSLKIKIPKRLNVIKENWYANRTKDIKLRYEWKRSLSLVIPLIGVVFVGVVWIPAFKQFGAFLGLFSAGLAIALKDPLTNFAGWIFLLFCKPFVVGDRVQIGEHAGDVVDIIKDYAKTFSANTESEILEASKTYLIYYKNLTPIIYTTVKDFGVMLTIRYLCNPRKRRSSEHEIWEEIIARFKQQPDIQFAYPTTRFYKSE